MDNATLAEAGTREALEAMSGAPSAVQPVVSPMAATNKALARAITEGVCKEFMRWLADPTEAPIGLKSEVYEAIVKILSHGIEG